MFVENNFKFDENGRKLSKRVESTVGKRRNCSLRAISPFSHGVFKRLELQTLENRGLFGKRLNTSDSVCVLTWNLYILCIQSC